MQPEKLVPVKRTKVAAAAAEHAELSPEQLQLIKDTVARNATDAELQLFLHLSTRYNLDPFAKEIWCLKYSSNQPATIFTSRDGYLKIANYDPAMDGLVSDVVYQNDELQKQADGSVVHTYGRPDRGSIQGAYALVYRKDRSRPTYFYAPLNEYKTGNNPTWNKYPSAMIVKVAEAMALKRAFSISGLVTKEEIGLEPDAEQTPEAETSAMVVAPEPPKKAPAEAVAPASVAQAQSIGADQNSAGPDIEQLRRDIINAARTQHITRQERSKILAPLNTYSVERAQKCLAYIEKTAEQRMAPGALDTARLALRSFANANATQLGEEEYNRLHVRAGALTVTAADLIQDQQDAAEWLQEEAARA